MQKDVYEMVEDYHKLETVGEKIHFLKNCHDTLRRILWLTYAYKGGWRVAGRPTNFKFQNTPDTMAYATLHVEVRKFEMFTRPDISDRRINELLVQLLEALPLKDADIVLGVFRGDIGIEVENVKAAYPEWF